MVRGLKLFADCFAGYKDRYILIGGAACDIWLSKKAAAYVVALIRRIYSA